MFARISHWHGSRSRPQCGPRGCGPGEDAQAEGRGDAAHGGDGGGRPWFAWGGSDGGGFGVRRPLRFMARALGLAPEQLGQLAAILGDLKTERAQAAVDNRRRLTAIAAVFASDSCDDSKATEASLAQATSATRVAAAVARTLRDTHALLTPAQRQRLGYLLRTGALVI